MASIEVCPHSILQELLLNWNFSKPELARFIRSHSQKITAALKAKPEEISDYFDSMQVQRLTRTFHRLQQYEQTLRHYFNKPL